MFSSTQAPDSSTYSFPSTPQLHPPPPDESGSCGAGDLASNGSAGHENAAINLGYMTCPGVLNSYLPERVFPQAQYHSALSLTGLSQESGNTQIVNRTSPHINQVDPSSQQSHNYVLPGSGRQCAIGRPTLNREIDLNLLQRDLFAVAPNVSAGMVAPIPDTYHSEPYPNIQSLGSYASSLRPNLDPSSSSHRPSLISLHDSPEGQPVAVDFSTQLSSAPPNPEIESWLRSEVGIPAHLPVHLNSLQDYPPESRPLVHLKWLMALAIYGSPRRKLTLNGIFQAVEQKFPFYRISPDKKWKGSMRHSLSLHKMFTKVPRAISDPGKGGYWEVTIPPPGDLLKRPRKRRSASQSDEDDSASVSDESERYQLIDPFRRSTTYTPTSSFPGFTSPFARRASLPGGHYNTTGHGDPSSLYSRKPAPTFGQSSLLPARSNDFVPVAPRPDAICSSLDVGSSSSSSSLRHIGIPHPSPLNQGVPRHGGPGEIGMMHGGWYRVPGRSKRRSS